MKPLRIISSLMYSGIIVLSFVLYDRIVEILPVFRGVTVEKNLFWATRIQLINVLSYLALLILGNSLLRYREFKQSKAVAVSLVLTVLGKGIIEFLALFNESWLANSFVILIPLLVIGLTVSFYFSRYLFSGNRWKNLQFTLKEKLYLSALAIVYIAMNVPAVLYLTQK